MPRKSSVAGSADDPTIHPVKLELEGEEYTLIFDFNSIALAESITKVNLLEAIEFKGITAAQYRGIFYASLLKAQPEITLAEAGSLITLRYMPLITDAMVSAWIASMPAKDNEENPLEPAPIPANV